MYSISRSWTLTHVICIFVKNYNKPQMIYDGNASTVSYFICFKFIADFDNKLLFWLMALNNAT